MNFKTRKNLIEIAMKRKTADLLVRNVKLVDVFTGSILNTSVSISDGYFVGFGEIEAKEVIDGGGRYMLPGLIDAHLHLESSMLTPHNFANLVVTHGTTSVIIDPSSIANSCGVAGIKYFLSDLEAKNPSLDIRVMLPSCVASSSFDTGAANISAKDYSRLMDNKKVLGLSEFMNFAEVLYGDEQAHDKLELALNKNKMIDGNAPGLKHYDLDAYALSGVKTEYECASIDEMKARLSRGMYVQIKHGSTVRNLPTLIQGIPLAAISRCMFCSGDLNVETILNEGHLNRHLRTAVAEGLDPIIAIIMGTLNAAQAYGLNKGAIAPGREADFILLNDLKDFMVRSVYIKGTKVAEKGKMITPHDIEKINKKIPAELLNTIKINELPENPFKLNLGENNGTCTARIIQVSAGSILTKTIEREIKLDENGDFDFNNNNNLNLVAVIDRYAKDEKTKIALGIVSGFNLQNGAIASSISKYSNNIVIIGSSVKDMQEALKSIVDNQGGLAISYKGSLVHSLALPFAGIMSLENAIELNKNFKKLNKFAMAQLNIPNTLEPFNLLQHLTLHNVPSLRINASGLFDVKSYDFVSVKLD